MYGLKTKHVTQPGKDLVKKAWMLNNLMEKLQKCFWQI